MKMNDHLTITCPQCRREIPYCGPLPDVPPLAPCCEAHIAALEGRTELQRVKATMRTGLSYRQAMAAEEESQQAERYAMPGGKRC